MPGPGPVTHVIPPSLRSSPAGGVFTRLGSRHPPRARRADGPQGWMNPNSEFSGFHAAHTAAPHGGPGCTPLGPQSAWRQRRQVSGAEPGPARGGPRPGPPPALPGGLPPPPRRRSGWRGFRDARGRGIRLDPACWRLQSQPLPVGSGSGAGQACGARPALGSRVRCVCRLVTGPLWTTSGRSLLARWGEEVVAEPSEP